MTSVAPVEEAVSQAMALVGAKQSKISCASIGQTQKAFPHQVINLAGHWDLSRTDFSWLSYLCPYAVLPFCQGCIKKPGSLQSYKYLGWSSKAILVALFGDRYPGSPHRQLKKQRRDQAQQASIKSFCLSFFLLMFPWVWQRRQKSKSP